MSRHTSRFGRLADLFSASPPLVARLDSPLPASLAELREQLEFVEQADACMHTSDGRAWSVAEDVVDEVGGGGGGAVAGRGGGGRVALLETALKLVTVQCRRCSCRVAEDSTNYSKDWNHNICNDTEACMQTAHASGRPSGGSDLFSATSVA
jgi:hypothetical protein